MTKVQLPNGKTGTILESDHTGITVQWIMGSGWKHTVRYSYEELAEYRLEIIHQEAQEQLHYEHEQAIERGAGAA